MDAKCFRYSSIEGFFISDTTKTRIYTAYTKCSPRVSFRVGPHIKRAAKSGNAVVLRVDIEGYGDDGVSVIIVVSTDHVHKSKGRSHTSRLT